MSPAIGCGGERERRIALCVIAAAALCHEMLQIVMDLRVLRLASNSRTSSSGV
jgi:hypothetical protein